MKKVQRLRNTEADRTQAAELKAKSKVLEYNYLHKFFYANLKTPAKVEEHAMQPS